jgi:hypothetical protein
VAADVLCRISGRAPDGQGPVYRNAVAMASLLYGWLGLALLYRTAAPRAGRGPAVLAALGIGFGTFLYWYLAFAPTMAHAVAFFAAALVVWVWLGPVPPGTRRGLLLGAACGLAGLTRWANVLIVVLPLSDLLLRLLRRESGARREALALAAAGILVFSPQMIVWQRLYGSPLTIPQGAGFVAGAPAIAGVLFSPRHGLFSWSPLLYLALPGVVAFAAREPLRGLAALVLACALTRVNAGVADWWGGSAFGARRFDALLPVLGLGLALTLKSSVDLARRRPLVPGAVLVSAFVLWNVLLAAQYRSGGWEYDAAVAFEEMGRGAVSLTDRGIGSPFSLPASLWAWVTTGRAPADWESLYMDRPHGRWSVRMGEDDRMYLEDGWSAPVDRHGATSRLITGSAGLVVPLHRPQSARFGARLMSPTNAQLRVIVNGRPAGLLEAGPEWTDAEVDLDPAGLRAGRNLIRLRVLGEHGEVAVAGLWLEPTPGTP